MTVHANDRVLVDAPAIASEDLRDGNSEWVAALGDASLSHTASSVLVRSMRVNKQDISLQRLIEKMPSQQSGPDVLPAFGLVSTGQYQAFIQLPESYDPRQRYPLILFFHGRGGSATASNLLTREFDVFRLAARERGYIFVVPDYGSERWMNSEAEQITLDILAYLEPRLSIDPQRFYVMGTSMGGAAALFFTAQAHRPVAAVCDIFGITDFERFYGEGFFNESLARAYGGSPSDQPKAYRQRSAVHQIDNLKRVPTLIVHGSRDTTVPLWNSQVLYEKLKAVGAPVTLKVVPGKSHDNAIIRGLESEILDFFDSHRLLRAALQDHE